MARATAGSVRAQLLAFWCIDEEQDSRQSLGEASSATGDDLDVVAGLVSLGDAIFAVGEPNGAAGLVIGGRAALSGCRLSGTSHRMRLVGDR